MWLPEVGSGPESTRRISFRLGPKDPKAKNFLACRGQRVDFGKEGGQCRVLHLVAASTEKDVRAGIKLIFQEPTSESQDLYTLQVSRWNNPPAFKEEVAFLAPRYHAHNGVQDGAVALFHYMIKIREPRKLIAVQLPNEPGIKIAAITLEK
jgi:hypothetical protein